MLFDEEEIEIMSNALQAQLRESSQSDVVARRIFDDFLGARKLGGSRVLELGPGQYDLARTVAAAGATVISMDHDPAVIALGKKRGYEVILADFRSFDWGSLRGEFDGLMCRNAIAFGWFPDTESFGKFVDQNLLRSQADRLGMVVAVEQAAWLGLSGPRAVDPGRRRSSIRTQRFPRN